MVDQRHSQTVTRHHYVQGIYCMKRLWMLVGLILPHLVAAGIAEAEEAPRELTSNEPSYFAAAKDHNDASWHNEFYLSIKYPIFGHLANDVLGEQSSLYFAYNGKYDFYFNSRHSSPIISRLQNPGLIYKYKLAASWHNLTSIKSGYFHQSNGQTVDNIARFQATTNAIDYVSRGWDYIPLELKFSLPAKTYLYLNGRLFMRKQLFTIAREDQVFWEPNRRSQPKVSDYDGLRILLRKEFDFNHTGLQHIKLAAYWRTGYTAAHISQKYELTVRAYDFPLHAFYFNGFGREITTYHRKDSYIAIGIEML